MERLFQGDLMAILPEYVDSKGNCSLIYIKGSEPFIIEKTIKTVIRLLGKYYMIDLREVKKRYKPIVSSPNLIPIPLSKNDIFVPFKTRIPICKGDGAFGYINMRYIDKIKKGSKEQDVFLKDGNKINCLSSLNTIDKHIRNGKVVSRCYEERTMIVREDNYSIYDAQIIIKTDR